MNLLDISIGTAIAFITGGGILLATLALQRRFRRVKSIATGVLVSYLTVVMILAAGELFFRYVHADSGWDFTLAFKNWQERYWQENSRGFRDREWTAADFAGKTTLVVLGDSFASGWGVDDPADRFPDVLAQRLGDDYAVINLARPGTSTRSQLDILNNNPPQQPDIVLLQYFLNDIEDASASVSRFWEESFVDMDAVPRLVKESYLLNYIYWAIYPFTRQVNTTFEGSYWQWQYETYDNFAIWDIHEEEINRLIDEVESLGAELYVVIFPNMEDPVGSVPYVDRVKFAFEARGYDDEVMTLFDEVAAWDPAEVVASPRDAHPSAAFHRYVGNLIYERWFANRP